MQDKSKERFFCSNYDDIFATDDRIKSVEHQGSHAMSDYQIICTHDPLCDDRDTHHKKIYGEDS